MEQEDSMIDLTLSNDGDRGLNDDANEKSSVFSQLKPYCLELLALLQKPNSKQSFPMASLLRFLQTSPSYSLQPFLDYALFPLMLVLDSAVSSRSSEKAGQNNAPKTPHKVSDFAAEGVFQCLEELLRKCRLGSVEQMVVLMKKLTYAALLSPSEASEEFREGVIKCFRALLEGLVLCSDEACSCRYVIGLPALLESEDMTCSKSDLDGGECLLAFLRSQYSSAAVGHWLSLLLKAADAEVSRGHRGNAKLRIEAFFTIRVLIAKVGTADALAFFLPGVVSQFTKVLHVSKTMISGAAGSMEAFDQAIRALAEYLMIVLDDDANLSSLDIMTGFDLNKNDSIHSFLNELRQLPISNQAQSKIASEESVGEAVTPSPGSIMSRSVKVGGEIGSLHVDRTRDWIEKTSANVDKMLNATFPHICVHPAKRVRQGLLAATRGLLSKCCYTLKRSRLMLLECLFVLIVDDSEGVSAPAQEFLEYLLFSRDEHHLQHDVAEIFTRLVERLPKVVLGNEETIALSHAQKLLGVMYYSGPQFVLNHLQSPVMAARFLDVFAISLSPNSVFTGALDKLTLTRKSSIGYLGSITELKATSRFADDCQIVMDAVPSDVQRLRNIQEKGMKLPLETVQDAYELPCMPPWFVCVGSPKLYGALAGNLRLVGLSLMADSKGEGHISVVTDIPLGYLRKLVSEVRVKEYNKESWQSWYYRTGSGHLLRQASTAACMLNEMIFGVSDQAVDNLTGMFQKSIATREWVKESDARASGCQQYTIESAWKFLQQKACTSHLIDCIGRILHEYLSCEIWDLPTDHNYSLRKPDGDVEEISKHFFQDTAMLHQVIIDGIGIFSLCLGKDFASSGFLHSSLYLLLESLICSNFQVRNASDAVLHVLSSTLGYPTVGQLVLANADYVVDSICRQLRHLDLNPHVPNVLSSMLSYVGAAHKILPLLEEPMCYASQEVEILGRHQHPELTIPFLKAVAEIVKALKREAFSLPTTAESYLMHIKSKISDLEKEINMESRQSSISSNGNNIDMTNTESEQWEDILFKLNDSKGYRRTVGSIAGSCLTAATPLLSSMKQAECLVALDIVEDGIMTIAKVEEAYRHEKESKEAMEEMIQSYFHQLPDTLNIPDEGTDENRLLPSVNKIWPFLVACVRNKNPVAVRRCLSVVANVIQISGGDFFSRRFHADGLHFWKLLSTSPFQRKPFSKEERNPLQLPYRSAPTTEDSMAEVSTLKVQIALLNMIADLSRNKRSASALQVVFKKVSGLVVGIACSGVTGLHDASINALQGLATVDPDLIWLLLADIYYSLKTGPPSPPSSDFPPLPQVLPPALSSKEYLYLQYGGQAYGFDIDFPSAETAFKKLQSTVFTNQMYCIS